MPKKPMSGYQETGKNQDALFTLKVHRGDGMALLGMNWKNGKPPLDFVGFSIEYKEPKGEKFFPLRNRINFPGAKKDDPNVRYTLHSPPPGFVSVIKTTQVRVSTHLNYLNKVWSINVKK